MPEILLIVFSVIVLIYSVVLHEIAHGAVANSLGDPTAKFAGRLSINPLKHLDLYGSFLVPLALFFFTRALPGGPVVFAWAKPVPINPFNFRDQKFGEIKVAVAGVAVNFMVALVFGLIMRFWPLAVNPVLQAVYLLFAQIVYINLLLAVFNLIPIPPLDGSHILFKFLGPSQEDFKLFLQRYYLLVLIFFFFILIPLVFPIISYLFYLIVGSYIS